MTKICAQNRARIFVLNCNCILAFITIVFLSFSGNSQLEVLPINTNIQSGQIQEIDSINTTGILQFIVVDLDGDLADIIYKEFSKYSGEIIGFGQAVIDGKIIVSYQSPQYPNFLLAILDRLNIKGYYDQNGVNIFYEKDGKSAFIR